MPKWQLSLSPRPHGTTEALADQGTNQISVRFSHLGTGESGEVGRCPAFVPQHSTLTALFLLKNFVSKQAPQVSCIPPKNRSIRTEREYYNPAPLIGVLSVIIPLLPCASCVPFACGGIICSGHRISAYLFSLGRAVLLSPGAF